MNGQEVVPQRFHPIMLGFDCFIQSRSGAPRLQRACTWLGTEHESVPPRLSGVLDAGMNG